MPLLEGTICAKLYSYIFLVLDFCIVRWRNLLVFKTILCEKQAWFWSDFAIFKACHKDVKTVLLTELIQLLRKLLRYSILPESGRGHTHSLMFVLIYILPFRTIFTVKFNASGNFIKLVIVFLRVWWAQLLLVLPNFSHYNEDREINVNSGYCWYTISSLWDMNIKPIKGWGTANFLEMFKPQKPLL